MSFYEQILKSMFPKDWEQSHQKILNRLFYTPFRWSVSTDEDRYMDAMAFRQRFSIRTEHEANVLEVLLSLSSKYLFEVDGDDSLENAAKLVIELLDNSGLGVEDTYANDFNIEDKIYRILDREYDARGNGGFFPIPDGVEKPDQRRQPIWLQFHDYMSAKTIDFYPFADPFCL